MIPQPWLDLLRCAFAVVVVAAFVLAVRKARK
jgi:hypothetical protein